MTMRPLNAFRGFKPAPGQEPEINVQLDVAGVRVRRAGKEVRSRHEQPSAQLRAALWWLVPLAALLRLIGWETDWGARCAAPSRRRRSRRSRSSRRCCRTTRSRAASPRAPRRCSARCSIRPRRPAPVAAPEAAKARMQRGQFALTGTMVIAARTRRSCGDRRRQVAPRERRRDDQRHAGRRSQARSRQSSRSATNRRSSLLKVATNPRPSGRAGRGPGGRRRGRGAGAAGPSVRPAAGRRRPRRRWPSDGGRARGAGGRAGGGGTPPPAGAARRCAAA